MKKEQVFLIVYGIAVFMHLFFTARYWITDGADIFTNLVWDFSFVFNFILQYAFLIFGIIGFKNLYTKKDINDRFVKAYVIYRLFYFVLNVIFYDIIMRLMEGGSSYSPSTSYIISNVVNIVLMTSSIMIYGKRPHNQYSKTKVNNSRVRFYNYFIDSVFLFSVSFQYAQFYSYQESGFSLIIYFFIAMLYFTISEGLMRQSFGKLLTKTHVYKAGGFHAPFTSILRRTACRFIPFEPFSFLDGKGEGWHDRLSSTYVFHHKEEAFEEDEDDIIKHLVD